METAEQVKITLGLLSKKFRFIQIPSFIIKYRRDLNLDNNEIAFLCQCYSYGDNCFASLSTLANEMNVSTQAVRRYAQSLEEKKLLNRIYRLRNDEKEIKLLDAWQKEIPEGWRYTSSIYDFSPLELKAFQLAVAKREVTEEAANKEMIQRLQRGTIKNDSRGTIKNDSTVLSKMIEELDYNNKINYEEEEINCETRELLNAKNLQQEEKENQEEKKETNDKTVDEQSIKEEIPSLINSFFSSSSSSSFIEMMEKYKAMQQDEGADGRKRNGIVFAILQALGVKVTYSVVGKARKIGDDALFVLLWRMEGLRMAGKLDDPSGYLHKCLYAIGKEGKEKKYGGKKIDYEALDKDLYIT